MIILRFKSTKHLSITLLPSCGWHYHCRFHTTNLRLTFVNVFEMNKLMWNLKCENCKFICKFQQHLYPDAWWRGLFANRDCLPLPLMIQAHCICNIFYGHFSYLCWNFVQKNKTKNICLSINWMNLQHYSLKAMLVVIHNCTTWCWSCTTSVKKTMYALQAFLCLSPSIHDHLSFE